MSTAQELADRIKRRADDYAEKYKDAGGFDGRVKNSERLTPAYEAMTALHHDIDQLRAVASQAEPVAWVRDQRGAFEGPETLDPLFLLGAANPGKGMHGATYSPLVAPATPPAPAQTKPIDMVLHCPNCGMQHIDAPEYQDPNERDFGLTAAESKVWKNPPHRSHQCHGCGHIWRPADVPTNGVQVVKTKGKADSPIVQPAQAEQSEDGRDAARWREVAERFCGWDFAEKLALIRIDSDEIELTAAGLGRVIDAAIAAKEQS